MTMCKKMLLKAKETASEETSPQHRDLELPAPPSSGEGDCGNLLRYGFVSLPTMQTEPPARPSGSREEFSRAGQDPGTGIQTHPHPVTQPSSQDTAHLVLCVTDSFFYLQFASCMTPIHSPRLSPRHHLGEASRLSPGRIIALCSLWQSMLSWEVFHPGR